MEEQKIDIKGKPFFIVQTETGIFKVVNKAVINLSIAELVKWNYEFDDGIGQLEIGIDIREVPVRNLELAVRYKTKECALHYIMEVCKRFAEVSGHDYFGLEHYGDYLSEFLVADGNNAINLIRSRLFRKIVNN